MTQHTELNPASLPKQVRGPVACALLGCSRATLGRLIKRGHLLAHRLPGAHTPWRVDRESLLDVARAAGRIA